MKLEYYYINLKKSGPLKFPQQGAFFKHCERGFNEVQQWKTTSTSMLDIRGPKENGWKFEYNLYLALTTDNMIAPSSLMQLVSCNYKGNGQTKRCVCLKNNVKWTDFCGCNDKCENTDPSPNFETESLFDEFEI